MRLRDDRYHGDTVEQARLLPVYAWTLLGTLLSASTHKEAQPVSPGTQCLTTGTSIFGADKGALVAAAAADTKLVGWRTSAGVLAFLVGGGRIGFIICHCCR
jgi:hypothetical protein